MYYRFGEYVSVEQKRKKAEKLVEKLRTQGQQPKPVAAFKGRMAATFWGKSWCDNLEAYADFENRLGRGRSYARSGCLCHLDIERGTVKALVSGSDLYTLTVRVKPLPEERWREVCARCSGQVGSLLELLQGKISRQVMEIMCDPTTGIFPSPAEITFDCSCPDWASMCKHVAATLYGVGRRLDAEPDLLFVLRGVNAEDLIPASLDFTQNAQPDALDDDDLGALFGIDLDVDAQIASPPVSGFPDKPKLLAKASTAPKVTTKAAPDACAKPPFRAGRPTGAAIRRLRKLAGLTPAAFARALGVSIVTLHRWEESKGVLTLRAASMDSLLAFQEKLFAGRQL
ncbi:helix-turn-helix domain-containing protein [Desulfovibrio sp. OttesenSCG-928-A18]|nr:helix-turn-helix domain-containing protein [Desulfovibrio sp. OttesenSCG-928-A18]